MAAARTLKLVSKSGSLFEVEEDIMKKSALVQTLLADAGTVNFAIVLVNGRVCAVLCLGAVLSSCRVG